jgi:small-conductance mechanosensitive channel
MIPAVTIPAAGTEVISQGLTAFDWIRAGAVLVAGVMAAVLLRHSLRRRLHQEDFEPQASLVAGRLVALAVTVAAFFVSLSLLGIRLGPAIGAIGIGGIAVALAAQSMLSDLIASILLQARRPFRRGDLIASNGLEGRVEDVNFRTVVLRNYDGQRLFLPASKVLNEPITNYTALGRRRSRLTVGVSYEADPEAATAVLMGAIGAVEGVHARPAPEALVTGFDESALTVDLLFWHAPDGVTTRRIRSAVAVAAKKALDAAGIEIPYPQRVLRFTDSWTAPLGPQPAPSPPSAEEARSHPGGSSTGWPSRRRPESRPPPPR